MNRLEHSPNCTRIPGSPVLPSSSPARGFGTPWLLLCFAFCFHVADEALTHFLDVYNPTVIAIRERLGWWPMPTFQFREWLIGLIIANAILLALTPLAYRNTRPLRPFAWFYAVIMLLNGMGHTLFTILGRTVESVQFSRPAPGFYSSPFLLVASVYLLVRLRHTAAAQPGANAAN
jgi:hypothetical protein